MSELPAICEILRQTLQLGPGANALGPNTPLLGSMPELDSMAVVAVLTAIEERYGIAIDDSDVSAEVFETVASLSDFVDSQLTR